MTLHRIVSICKGGGYRYCRTVPPHPKANSKGLYPLHRVQMENKLGRYLDPGEVVHHKDEDKANDAIGNLEVKTSSAHTAEHHACDPVSVICGGCGKNFLMKPHVYRLRVGRNLTGQVSCSRSCGRLMAEKLRC